MWMLHVDAATRLAQALMPAMAQRGAGRVVLIGSRVAQGMPGRSQYAATKAALIALARSWAAEFAARGVTVNVVSPAATQTGMLSDPARAASMPRLPPIGRLIQPQEIAALVDFLLKPEAAAITGQDIAICGGASLPR
jgi:NAD(P)-dependent dehydrogenase (short-subunit alcohol dehydrogenase family)